MLVRTGAAMGREEATRPAARSAPNGRYPLVFGALALAGLVVLLGCGNPRAESRLALRRDNLQWTADTLAWRERIAGERLARDGEYIRNDIARDAEKWQRDLRAAKAYLEFDLRRWQERQGAYLRAFGEIFGGQPEDIEPTAIIMFL